MRPLRFVHAAHSSVAVVHAMSRVIEGRKVFDALAKVKFRKHLAKHCAFSQVELVTFCLMGNHFHLLLRIDHDAPNPLNPAIPRRPVTRGRAGSKRKFRSVRFCGAVRNFVHVCAVHRRAHRRLCHSP